MTDDRMTDLITRALDVAPGGVHSNARLGHAGMFFARGEGAHLWDVTGKRYVDYVLGRGPALLGHTPRAVLEAATAAAHAGLCLGSQHPLEVLAAETLRALLGWPEMIRFTTTGVDAVQLALAVARGCTGRSEVVRFEGHYHGWLGLTDEHVLPWNDETALAELLSRRGERVAAVIMEPVLFTGGGRLPAPGYLAVVRQLTERCGALLVFDEIVTGARVAPGGAAQLFGVRPDLATFAKGIGAGWPVGAVAGGRAGMATIADSTVDHRGTYNGSTASMAAVVAAVDAIAGGAVHRHLDAIGSRLQAGMAEIAAGLGVRLRIRGYPAVFALALVDRDPGEPWEDGPPPNWATYQRLAAELIDRGVWVSRRGNWYVSAAHTEDDVAHTLDAFQDALKSVAT
jgi:glutamate-1-semialdehyde 2,1-aminomutase